MEKIDWSKAPEGATHYWPCHGSFYTKIGGKFYLAENIEVGRVNSPASWVKSLIQRPSKAWSGEGLPPVGVVCELRCLPSGGWGVAEIKYMSHTMCVWLWLRDDGGEQIELAEAPCVTRMEFRPIRTPEQIAADEREAAIKEMLEDAGRPDTAKTRDQAQLLYDAGWRKVERAQ